MKSAVMNPRDSLFQIEVVEPRKRKPNRDLMFDFSPSASSVLQAGKDKVKYADIPNKAPTRTLLKFFKDGESARKWGERVGTVIACFKVDRMRYLENIEHLNLTQAPASIGIAREGFVIDKDLTLTRLPQDNFNVEITH